MYGGAVAAAEGEISDSGEGITCSSTKDGVGVNDDDLPSVLEVTCEEELEVMEETELGRAVRDEDELLGVTIRLLRSLCVIIFISSMDSSFGDKMVVVSLLLLFFEDE